jgi:preprotein translocase subunit SecA
MSTQREVIYGERGRILAGEDLREQVVSMIGEVVTATVERLAPPEVFSEEWDLDLLVAGLREVYPSRLTPDQIRDLGTSGALLDAALEEAQAAYEERERHIGEGPMRNIERLVLLNIIDTKWREHLGEMDYLQEGIHLRAYAQKDPITEYRREAFGMFEELTTALREDFVRYIYRVELVRQDEPGRPRPQRVATNEREVAGPVTGARGGGGQAKADKVPRNAPCPCGSGKKFKKCHGAAA